MRCDHNKLIDHLQVVTPDAAKAPTLPKNYRRRSLHVARTNSQNRSDAHNALPLFSHDTLRSLHDGGEEGVDFDWEPLLSEEELVEQGRSQKRRKKCEDGSIHGDGGQVDLRSLDDN